jgi:hypothetical protein
MEDTGGLIYVNNSITPARGEFFSCFLDQRYKTVDAKRCHVASDKK